MAAIQSTLTKYSTPYLPSPGLYSGAPIHQHTGSASAIGSSSATRLTIAAKSGTGSGVGSSSATRLRIVPRNATGSAVGNFTVVISGPIQFRLGGLSDYSFPYLNGGRFYVGAPLKQRAATGSATGTSTATGISTRARMATGSGTGTSSATGVRIAFRTATGSAVGSFTIVISGPIQLRLGRLTDYSFPYLSGGRYYIGPAIYERTAVGSGTGTQSATRLVKNIRQATGSGAAGESTSTDKEILFRFATGSATSSSEADPFLFLKRTASASAAGSSSVSFLRGLLRVATGAGAGTSSAVRLVKNRRAATGSAVGSAVAVRRIVNIRFATASGTATSSSVSIELLPRTATASGVGSTSGQVLWSKSRIFRVPQTTTYTFATTYGTFNPKERLMAHIVPQIRAENLYRLSDGTYTINDPRNNSAVRTYLGAHNIFLDDTEVAELTAAGYGAYIT
jgi:hypothetical protein